ncbi:arsenate reductase ArsC [Alphaproteobacteria bacterium LSUCC0684]
MTTAPAFPGTVLFACTHNMIRSPMAEGIMKQLYPNRVFVDSCGINAGSSDGFVIAVMQEIGIDMTGHEPKSFSDLDDEFFDLIICFSEDSYKVAAELARTRSTEVEYWPVFDAGLASDNREERLAAYRLVRDRIHELVRERFST